MLEYRKAAQTKVHCGSLGQGTHGRRCSDDAFINFQQRMAHGLAETAFYPPTVTTGSEACGERHSRARFQPSDKCSSLITSTPIIHELNTGANCQAPPFPCGPVTLTMMAILRSRPTRSESGPNASTYDGSVEACLSNSLYVAPNANRDPPPSGDAELTMATANNSDVVAAPTAPPAMRIVHGNHHFAQLCDTTPSLPRRPAPLPPPVQVQVASRCRRGGGANRPSPPPPSSSTAAAAAAAVVKGRITRGAVGVFHPRLYLEGGDCIECGSKMMSRGRFEKLGGTATAKWHVSIKVVPSGMTLGRWLQEHGLPVLQGRPRKRKAARKEEEEREQQHKEEEEEEDGENKPEVAGAAAAVQRLEQTHPLPPLPALPPPLPPPPPPPLCEPFVAPSRSAPDGPNPSNVAAGAMTHTSPAEPAAEPVAADTAAGRSTSDGIVSFEPYPPYPPGREPGSGGAVEALVDGPLLELLESSGILEDICGANNESC
ncbi:hypothetical protein PLESTF_000177200 [Pleodorina starrii]|nr:hypothetical protein PLESTF_000177200 [Pleodorina starrii]